MLGGPISAGGYLHDFWVIYMTKGEYIDGLQKKAEKSSKATSKKGKLRQAIMLALLCAGSVITCALGVQRTKSIVEDSYTRFMEDPTSVTLEGLGYRDTFDIWNASEIGNDVNCLLSGGNVCLRDGISAYPAEHGGTAVLRDGQAVALIESGASYINAWNNLLIFRDNGTHGIRSCSLATGLFETIAEGNIGEVFVTGDKAYFIDLSANRNICSVGLDGGAREIIVQTPSDMFAVVGDTLVYRDFANEMYGHSLTSGEETVLGHGVERFFIADGFFVESDDEIYRTDTVGTNPELIYTAADETMKMVGATGQTLFIQESGRLYALKGGEKTELVSEEHALYNSLCVDGDKLMAVTIKDAADARISEAYIEVPLTAGHSGS